MIDKSLLNIPVDVRLDELPLLSNYAEFAQFLYLYSPFQQPPGFAIRLWWEDNCGRCRHRVYSTGTLEMPLPNDLHTRVAAMMARTGLNRWKAAQAVTEESWSGAQVEFDQMLRERNPAVDRECIVESTAFTDVIRIGALLALTAQIQHPDVLDGVSTRIVAKSRETESVSMISYGGRFDDQSGISDALRQLERLSELAAARSQ